MKEMRMQLFLYQGEYSVVRLAADAAVPAWADTASQASSGESFITISRTPDELSIVCRSELVNDTDVEKVESGWRTYRVAGQLDFDQVGIVAGLSRCLAEVGIPLFCVSTFDTDYFLVRERDRAGVEHAWRDAGHTVRSSLA